MTDSIKNITTSDKVIRFIIISLLGIISYFLQDIGTSIKVMNHLITELRIEQKSIKTQQSSDEKRFDRIEKRLDKLETKN